MIYEGTIYDQPLKVNVTFDPSMIQELNRAWIHNATLLAYFCLIVGFLIGAGAVYLYYWRKRREDPLEPSED